MNLSQSRIIIFRISLAAAVSGILILATTPLEYPVVSNINDKLNHIFAFFILALLTDFSFPDQQFSIRFVLLLMGYGIAIEIIQYFIPYRMFSLIDVAADATGIILYRILFPVVKKSADLILTKK